MNNKARTDYLFATPSFLAGVARLFDFGCTFDQYNRSESNAEADARAIASDWAMVGKDISFAMNQELKTIPRAKARRY